MLVDRISHGSAQFTFTDQDLNALGLACSLAGQELVSQEDAAASALIEALGAAFTGAWYACKAHLGVPVTALAADDDNHDG